MERQRGGHGRGTKGGKANVMIGGEKGREEGITREEEGKGKKAGGRGENGLEKEGRRWKWIGGREELGRRRSGREE